MAFPISMLNLPMKTMNISCRGSRCVHLCSTSGISTIHNTRSCSSKLYILLRPVRCALRNGHQTEFAKASVCCLRYTSSAQLPYPCSTLHIHDTNLQLTVRRSSLGYRCLPATNASFLRGRTKMPTNYPVRVTLCRSSIVFQS